ncbi:MAG: sugar fermentation stimulation protein A [Bacteroidia bacterium]|jgi:sugar fermentation stimulation protein A
MHIDQPLVEATLVKRYKRFLTDVILEDGSELTAHCPNTGSLLGCKDEGSKVWLRDTQNDKRKYRMSWQAIEVNGTWVNVDTGLPNAEVFEAINEGRVPKLAGYDKSKREVKYGNNSRIDVLLEKDNGEKCYVEVKNTTLVEGDVALFPDAVTERGRKHLGELVNEVKAGNRAVQFFFVSRDDVKSFKPCDAIDPKYGAALREAAKAGVEVMAWSVSVGRDTIELHKELEIDLS